MVVLRWPLEEHLRRDLGRHGLPRLLVVDPGVRPPVPLDEREDWMRSPPDPFDLQVRCEALRRRHAVVSTPVPILDDDGLLWVDSAWVALTVAQAPVLRLLLHNVNKVVHFEAVATAYEGTGGSGHPASVRTLLSRLRARVRPLGLDLVAVRRRGVILTMNLRAVGQD